MIILTLTAKSKFTRSKKHPLELGDILPFRTNKKRSNRQQSV
jgi:hypothetical protein